GWIAPGHMSLLTFKPLLALAILCSALWLGRRWKALWSVFYVILYPLNFVLLRVPYLVLRQQSWDLAIAFMNGVGAFFISLRHTITMATWFVISAAVVL